MIKDRVDVYCTILPKYQRLHFREWPLDAKKRNFKAAKVSIANWSIYDRNIPVDTQLYIKLNLCGLDSNVFLFVWKQKM